MKNKINMPDNFPILGKTILTKIKRTRKTLDKLIVLEFISFVSN